MVVNEEREPFAQLLFELLNKAKGERRSWNEYARNAGVSNTSFTKLFSSNHYPTEKFLRKVTSEEACPQNGVSYGVITSGIQQFLKDSPRYAEESGLGRWLSDGVQPGYASKKAYIGSLVVSNYDFRHSKEKEINSWGNRLPIPRGIKTVKYQVYGIDYISVDLYFIFPSDKKGESSSASLNCLMPLFNLGQSKHTKVSIVANSLGEYQSLLQYKDCIPYRGYLSVIYFDGPEHIVETYLSQYEVREDGVLDDFALYFAYSERQTENGKEV